MLGLIMCPERTRLSLLSLLPGLRCQCCGWGGTPPVWETEVSSFSGSWEEAVCCEEVENMDSEKSVHPVRVPHEAYGSVLCSHVLSGRQKQDSRGILSQTLILLMRKPILSVRIMGLEEA